MKLKKMPSKEVVGDTHNFGEKVEPYGKHWIIKPRTTLWEQLFLGDGNSFRALLDEVLAGEAIIQTMPKISFRPHRSKSGGEAWLVEKIEIEDLKPSEFDIAYVLEAFGGMLALCSWFGIDDLHRENVFFGRCKHSGALVLSPVDIETIFKSFLLPIGPGLLRVKGQLRYESGSFVIQDLIDSASDRERLAVIYGYLKVTDRLILNSKRILTCLKTFNGFKKTPIRAVIRATKDYAAVLGADMGGYQTKDRRPLNSEEKEQLARKDIPYFFRTLHNPKIQYYTQPAHQGVRVVRKSKKLIGPLIEVERLFTGRQRTLLLRDHGVCLLACYFLAQKKKGTLLYRDLRIELNSKKIRITPPAVFGKESNPILESDRFWKVFLQRA